MCDLNIPGLVSYYPPGSGWRIHVNLGNSRRDDCKEYEQLTPEMGVGVELE